jgi:hypothetical protein
MSTRRNKTTRPTLTETTVVVTSSDDDSDPEANELRELELRRKAIEERRKEKLEAKKKAEAEERKKAAAAAAVAEAAAKKRAEELERDGKGKRKGRDVVCNACAQRDLECEWPNEASSKQRSCVPCQTRKARCVVGPEDSVKKRQKTANSLELTEATGQLLLAGLERIGDLLEDAIDRAFPVRSPEASEASDDEEDGEVDEVEVEELAAEAAEHPSDGEGSGGGAEERGVEGKDES